MYWKASGFLQAAAVISSFSESSTKSLSEANEKARQSFSIAARMKALSDRTLSEKYPRTFARGGPHHSGHHSGVSFDDVDDSVPKAVAFDDDDDRDVAAAAPTFNYR